MERPRTSASFLDRRLITIEINWTGSIASFAKRSTAPAWQEDYLPCLELARRKEDALHPIRFRLLNNNFGRVREALSGIGGFVGDSECGSVYEAGHIRLGGNMEKVQNFGDNRNKGWCVHCGGANESRDHCPSRVFLDKPYPEDLPASPACESCNNSFSQDEAYVAALIESVLAGAADPDRITRPKIAEMLRRNPSLGEAINAGRSETNEGTVFDVDQQRVRRVVLKLARGHAAFEFNEPRIDEPDYVAAKPLMLMTEQERSAFENGEGDLAVWPEVGSRAMNRLLIVGSEVLSDGWLHVQNERYRYRVGQEGGGLNVRLVIREYLACEVIWRD